MLPPSLAAMDDGVPLPWRVLKQLGTTCKDRRAPELSGPKQELLGRNDASLKLPVR